MPLTRSHLSSLYFGDMLLLAATKKKKDMKEERNSLERERRSMGEVLKEKLELNMAKVPFIPV